MPSVNLTPETYEKLKKIAARRGCTPDEVAQSAVERHVADESLSDEAWRREFRALREEIQAAIPSEVSEEEIQADIDAAIREVRDERARARRH